MELTQEKIENDNGIHSGIDKEIDSNPQRNGQRNKKSLRQRHRYLQEVG